MNEHTSEHNAPTELQKQQTDWLTASYSGLFQIALAITRNGLLAEDAVSDAVTSCFEKILSGDIRADNPKQFVAFIHRLVRNKAKNLIGAGAPSRKYSGIAQRDLGREELERETRPDRSYTSLKAGMDGYGDESGADEYEEEEESDDEPTN